MKNEGQLSRTERHALREALEGEQSWKAALRSQVDHITVKSRSANEAGGFVDLIVKGNGFEISDVSIKDPGYPPVATASHPQLKNGGGYVVWVSDGLVSCIEYYSNDESPWPANDEHVVVSK